MGKLTARKVETAKPGKYGDGAGLQLAVADSGAKKWVLRFLWQGKGREMGLGSYPEVSLAEAREKALTGRRLARSGIDPIAARRKGEGIPTFGELADEMAAQLSGGFRNDKHKAQWRMTLTVYAEPLRTKAVDKIETTDVLGVLQPIWQEKPETASRLRGRIERVLNAAKAKGYRTGENPATWRGHLENLLPKRSTLSRGHHAATPYAEVPAFVAGLRERPATAARALELCILTATRSGEVLAARWDEIDFDSKTWTVPAGRTKAAREHRVPLSDRALAILREMEVGRTCEYIFPGQRAGRPLSGMAFEMLLRRAKSPYTAHGFRSSFRDWAGNETNFPREIAEHALAHVIGDKAEQAYRRSDALMRRRELMDAWARHCQDEAGENVLRNRQRQVTPSEMVTAGVWLRAPNDYPASKKSGKIVRANPCAPPRREASGVDRERRPELSGRPRNRPMASNVQRRAYSVREAARMCGLSRATLYRLLKEGKITSIKIGTRRLIRDDQINALLAGGA
jgi:excisionase family DNA binding protein